MTTPLDDLTPKERTLKAYLQHLLEHEMTDLAGLPGCGTCEIFKKALE